MVIDMAIAALLEHIVGEDGDSPATAAILEPHQEPHQEPMWTMFKW